MKRILFTVLLCLFTISCLVASDNSDIFDYNYELDKPTAVLEQFEVDESQCKGESETKNWLVLIYASLDDSDEDVERNFFAECLRLMLNKNAGQNVHIAVQMGFHSTDEDKALRYYCENGKFYRKKVLPQCNLGSPDTLADFIEWATSYKAGKKAFFIHGHGSGVLSYPDYRKQVSKSFCYDDSSKDCLTIQDAKLAFNKGLNGEKIDILTFLNCYMNQVEAAWQFAPFCRYYIASQTSQWMDGSLEIPDFMNLFDDNAPAPGAEELCVAVYDFLMKKNLDIKPCGTGTEDFRLSCLDLVKLTELKESMKSLSESLCQALLDENDETVRNYAYKALYEAKDGSPSFNTIFCVPGSEDMIQGNADLGSLLSLLSQYLNNYSDMAESDQLRTLSTDVIKNCESILNILESAALRKMDSSGKPGIQATSILLIPYYEDIAGYYLENMEGYYSQTDFCIETGWHKVINSFYNVSKARSVKSLFSE